jgi:hypothetical protein
MDAERDMLMHALDADIARRRLGLAIIATLVLCALSVLRQWLAG